MQAATLIRAGMPVLSTFKDEKMNTLLRTFLLLLLPALVTGCATKSTDKDNLARVNNYSDINGDINEQIFLACHNKRPATYKDIYQLAKYYPSGDHNIVIKATQSSKEKRFAHEGYLATKVNFKPGRNYSLLGTFNNNTVNVMLVDAESGKKEALSTIKLVPSHRSPHNQTFKLCRTSTI